LRPIHILPPRRKRRGADVGLTKGVEILKTGLKGLVFYFLSGTRKWACPDMK